MDKQKRQQALKNTEAFHQAGIGFWLALKPFATFEFKVYIEERIQELEHRRAFLEVWSV